MPDLFGITDTIKRKTCAYLIQRYIGHLFEEKVTSEQLKVDLISGTGLLQKISLDVQALNELGEKQNWPIEFVDGYIETLHISIPWRTIFSDKTHVLIDSLKLTIQPKQRSENATSMFESMWNSMTSSVHLAEECARQDETVYSSSPYEGLDAFASAIDSILSKVNVKFKNTVIQMEHLPQNSSTGVGMVIHIDEVEYSDESANDPTCDEATDLTNQDKTKSYLVNSYTTKRFSISKVSFSTVEFSRTHRTFSPSMMSQSQFDEPMSAPRNEILFGQLSSKQEIRVRLKQSEILHGPKVSIEMNLGPLLLFLSPRQVHVLLELANGMSSPDLEDTSNVAPKTKCVQKPMTGSDFQRIEQELQYNIFTNAHSKVTGLQGAHGWSTAPLDQSDTEESFLPIKNATGMVGSTFSGHSSSMESSFTSSMASSMTENTHRTRKRMVSNIDTDPRTEISHFQIRLASMAAVLVHEDILIQSSGDDVLVQTSVKQMQKISTDFFDAACDLILTAYGAAHFQDAESILDRACSVNHLRLLAVPIQVEFDEKTNLSAFSISGHLSVAKFELEECICDSGRTSVQHIQLLTFRNAPPSSNTAKPDVALSFKHVDKTSKSGLNVKNGSRTDVNIQLQNCLVELDLTIVDRINALINSPPICVIENTTSNLWNTPLTSEVLNNTTVDSKVDFKISCESISVILRFPITDFRPLNDLNRIEWWKRNVRSDYLVLTLLEALFQTIILTNQQFEEYNVTCQGLNIFYHESEGSPAIHVAKSGSEDGGHSMLPDELQKSKLSIKFFPIKKCDLDDLPAKPEDISTHSMCSFFLNPNKLTAPFSSVKVVHESDTPHSKNKDDPDELVIPGDKEEIDEFVKNASECTQIMVDIHLPTVSMQLIDKHTYELIYNRINNDLLMWKPSAPKPTKSYEKSVYAPVSTTIFEGQEVFSMCKSGIQYDSDSDSNASDEAPTIFYSTYDSRMKSSIKPHGFVQQPPKSQNAFVLNLQIGQGLVFLHTPVRDSSSKVIPNQHGEFLLNVEDAKIFVVSGYNGDDNLGYVCVQVHNAKLHHCDMISTASSNPPVKDIGTIPGRHLHPTIYKSDAGMSVDNNNRGGNREMLSVAVKIQASHETHHVKTILVAIGLNKSTLNHKMCQEPNSFISHIIDFFNVQDYPIPGYVSKDVLTEFHLHLWDCAIDYRPLNIPLRAAMTVGNFTMSSHLSAAANSSTLIFIAEECGLFISDKHPPKGGAPSTVPVDLRRDYVNVVEVGLFDLSLKTSDKKSMVNPHFDLRASNNKVSIKTCADSGKALMQLITYYASNGDLSPSDATSEASSIISSPKHNVEQELVNLDPQQQQISNLSVSQQYNVKELIGDALRESEPVEEGTEVFINNGAKLFYFPDEKQLSELSAGKPLAQVTSELGDVAQHSNRSSDTDEDFCIIGNEAGLGIFPRNGQPEIKWLTGDPVRMIENHFDLPTGKTDLLKPPKHFPVPLDRYTLCEMTIIWNMYGGCDFGGPKSVVKKKTVNFSDASRQTVQFNNDKKDEVSILTEHKEKQNNKKLTWIDRGGINRDHSVRMELQLSKVRFQHELYPENAKQASRQVLIISDIEVRDRLESSRINKFLYQYTSQAKPKQSHAHMLVIKAVHERQDKHVNSQECCLKISLLPLRLNIDQDSLLFLINFFTELAVEDSSKQEVVQSKHSTPTHQPPVMMVEEINKEEVHQQLEKIMNENFLIQLEEQDDVLESDENLTASVSCADDSSPVYFRKVTFSPDVPIQLDYHGKFLDMSKGPLAGILMGLGQLNKSELRLKRIDYRHGLLGIDKLITHLLQEWLNEIKKNQVPSLLRGVGPMHSVVQLFQGIRDLFWLPIEQYQKDGRIVRGLQRGANSFTTSTAMAALELTSRIIHLIQITAETAYDMLSPGPSVRRLRYKQKGRKKRFNQPQDIREGMTNAYQLVKEGIGETADNIVQVASHEHEQKGYSGAVGGVLRQIPPTILKPIILASEATSNLIDGARSQLEPDARREANQKWRINEG